MEKLTVEQWLGKDNKLGIDIFNNKYKNGEESFEESLDRISGNNKIVRDLIKDKKFIFAGRILSNRGLDKLGKKITYSNCYVCSPPDDNLESIFETAKKLARTYSYGGGCGVDISKLRPNGSAVKNTAKKTTGAVSFMELYDMTTSLIGQNGRRGALMLSLDVNHPDIIEFINIKTDVNKINKANISLRIDNKFMQCVEKNGTHICEFIVKDSGEVITKEFNAKELWDKIMYVNWDYADVGMLFWDEIKHYNLLEKDDEFEYAGTNPCAEEPLPAGGSCLLGSLILTSFVKNGEFDFIDFSKSTREAVIALDEVLDEGLPLHPLQEQRDSVRDWRQIGLGVLGLGDALIKMKIKYDSEEAIDFIHKLGQTMAHEALYQSALLAKKNGSYPKYKEIVMESEFFKNHASMELIELVRKYGLRHSQLLTSAPTGSLGTMLEISTGIEPNFAFSYTRKTESLHSSGDVYYKVYTKIVSDFRNENNLEESDDLPEYFVSAQDIDPIMRVRIQGALQRHIDASISSTVNLPNKATIEDVSKIYMTAWKERLKGITIFRDGCARMGVLTLDNPNKEEKKELRRGEIAPIPENLECRRVIVKHGCGSYTLHIYKDSLTGDIFDCFLNSKNQGCQSNVQAIAVLISLSLRGGITLEQIAKSLNGLGACPNFMVGKVQGKCSVGKSCSTAILQHIQNYKKETMTPVDIAGTVDVKDTIIVGASYLKCPECGEPIETSGGCYSCKHCGYSKCD